MRSSKVPRQAIIDADHLGSVRAMWSADGSEMLWARRYSAWGEKSVTFTSKHRSDAERLEQQCVWGYANFIEIPGVGSDIYWSASRAYAPSIKEWLSPDPMVKWNPRLAATKPGNWASTRYANNSPLTYVDPSGGLVVKIGVYGGGNAAAYAGGSTGWAVSYSGDKGWKSGTYNNVSVGAATGLPGGSAGVEISVSDGKLQTGVSNSITHGLNLKPYALGFGSGLDIGKSEDGENSVKVNLGFGGEVEAHMSLDREWMTVSDTRESTSSFSAFQSFETNSSSRDSSSFDHLEQNSCSKEDSTSFDHDTTVSRGWHDT